MTSNTPISTLSNRTLLLMAFATGACVANLVYAQPLLREIQQSFGGSDAVSDAQVGWIPTLTQVGYAFGMLFIVPLGDRFERRTMIFGFTMLAACALLAFAAAPTFWFACAASLAIGLVTMAPQLLIPFSVHLSAPEKRGQTIGTMMSGLLLGVLLGRTVSGFVGAAFGWRVMFGIAAGLLAFLAFGLRAFLPRSDPSFTGSYGALLKSVVHLVRTQPVLREAMVFGSMLYAAFSAFWATLIHLMESDAFHLGARAVGLYGVVGAGGALITPLVGRMADRRPARVATGVGILVTASAFGVYWIWGGTSLIALGVGVFLMDVGVQAGHIANQSRVFSLIPEARSRLNTAYMFSYFAGGALGSGVASLAWDRFGWSGVCGTALLFLGVAGVRYLGSRAHWLLKLH